MKKRFFLPLLILALLLAAAVFPRQEPTRPQVVHQHLTAPGPSPAASGFQPDGSLRTHLPIIILHTQGMKVPGTVRTETGALSCSYSIIDNPDGVNCSDSALTAHGRALISIRGNSSRDYPKAQYLLRTVDKTGQPEDVPMLGMPAESTWVLNGSYIDHSTIRNYLCYNLSAEISDVYVPRVRFCEVMTTDQAGVPQYQGVYLMTEKIKVSEKRLPLTPYDPAREEAAFLVQTNSHTDNLGFEHLKPNSVSAYPFDLEYPDPEVLTESSRRYIRNQLLRFEKSLHDAAFTESWESLEDHMDLDSFVDFYLINEFFQNYDAGIRSTYLYQDMDGKVFLGPVWDFDGTFNNFFMLDLKPNYLQLKYTIFFSYLSQDPRFVQRCVSRYQQLRRGVLSEEYLLDYIDSTSRYLGEAPLRNCDRWYNGNRASYQKDLDQMKQFVVERGRWMDENFRDVSGLIH